MEKGNQLAGKVFDRFQVGKDAEKLGGSFASPVLSNTEGVEDLVFTYDSRALASRIIEGTYYYKFRMKNNLPSDLEFEYGEAIPWFNLQGTADPDFPYHNLIHLFINFAFENSKKIFYEIQIVKNQNVIKSFGFK